MVLTCRGLSSSRASAVRAFEARGSTRPTSRRATSPKQTFRAPISLERLCAQPRSLALAWRTPSLREHAFIAAPSRLANSQTDEGRAAEPGAAVDRAGHSGYNGLVRSTRRFVRRPGH